ncbi:MAG: NADH-quinone oxidoreductase subunit J family protein [Vulcanimicrobiaceae bacterium]
MILFWALAVALIASAIFTITARKPVYSVVGLLANFVVLAMLYLSLSAEFIAFIQILVYSGAILILFVFVIALLSSGVGPFDVGPDRMPTLVVPGAVAALVAIGIGAWALAHAQFVPTPRTGIAFGPTGAPDVFGSVADFGTALFTTYLLPFEITAFILLVAVIGVVLLSADASPVTPVATIKRRARKREPIVKARR